MELRDYLGVLRRRWTLILAVTLVALMAAAFLTYQATPQYTSSARVFVSTSSKDTDTAYQGGLFTQQRVSSYADLVNGLELTNRVVDDLGLEITPDELSQRVTATVVPETVLLSISVTDPNPRQAQRINQALVSELTDFVEELETPAGGKRALIKATLIDPASLPGSPTSPQPVRNMGLALVLGLLAGFGVAVMRELLDTTIKSTDVAEEVAGAPALGGIGLDPDAATDPLITDRPAHSPMAEAFRVLRTNVQFLEVDSQSKAFVFTSSMPAEGKSSVASNLAIAMAQAGQRVLLVDADLRRPLLARRLGLEQGVGLTTVLLGQLELDDALQEVAGSRLTVLTSGPTPPNPAELLQSHAMEALVKQLRERFDVVILDSPPLLPVTDAALLASITDGAIIVASHGGTTREQLSGAVERLKGVGATPLGVVLNRVPRNRTGTGYGYGYGYGANETLNASTRLTRQRARQERKQQRLLRKQESRQERQRAGARRADGGARKAEDSSSESSERAESYSRH